MSAGTLVVVPMKDPALSKTRLHDALDQEERARFALHLFDRTMAMLADMRDRLDFDLAVVTGHDGIAARVRDAMIIREPVGAGLSDAITAAARHARKVGYQRLCVLPADLASPAPDDIAALLSQQATAPTLVLCPSRDQGTNALLAAPPDVIRFAYGPGSFHAHHAAGVAADLVPVVLPLGSLQWDIDTTADLTEYLRLGHGPA